MNKAELKLDNQVAYKLQIKNNKKKNHHIDFHALQSNNAKG